MSRRRKLTVLATAGALMSASLAFAPALHDLDGPHAHDGKALAGLALDTMPAMALSDVECVDGVLPDGGGFAGPYECKGIHLESVVPLGSTGGANGADSWVWNDPVTGDEYGIMNTGEGTVVVRITDPKNPAVMGLVPGTLPSNSDHGVLWRDVKVLADHAYIVSETGRHGIQILDLSILRDLPPDGTRLLPFTRHGDFDAHNIIASDGSPTILIAGSDLVPRSDGGCKSGLVPFDVSDPLAPTPYLDADGEHSCIFGGGNNVHDAQCTLYRGPDADHNGAGPDRVLGTADDVAPHEICLTANEDDGLFIVDITDKSNIRELANLTFYDNLDYNHQAWFTPDQRWVFFNDELDELPVLNNGNRDVNNTRTFWFDASDLDLGLLEFEESSDRIGVFEHSSVSIDHNLYTRDNLVYTANYGDGLRVLCWTDQMLEPGGGGPVEVAYFDMQPGSDVTAFYGAWSAIPYLDSGNIVVSTLDQGMFTLRLDESISRTDCGQ